MTDPVQAVTTFHDLNLAPPLLAALDEVGYEIPTPIQAEAIPHLMKGLDLLGHAPTGTGKTAAFALPLLSRLDIAAKHVNENIGEKVATTKNVKINKEKILCKKNKRKKQCGTAQIIK